VPEISTVTDKRISQTQRSLTNALIALTLEKGYDALTVRDISERAGIGYATFFRHFTDKDALLADVLERTLSEFLGLIQPVMNDPERTVTLVFEHVKQSPDPVRVLLRTRNVSPLLSRIFAFSSQAMLETLTPNPNSLIPPEIAAHHMIVSILELIEWWLEREMPYPPEHMGKIVNALIMQPTRTLAFLER
jgi:AcrR family transcriptional regulator